MSVVVDFEPKKTDTIGTWTVVAALPLPLMSTSRTAFIAEMSRVGRQYTYVADPHGTPETHTVTAAPVTPSGITAWQAENYGAEAQTSVLGSDPDDTDETVAWRLLLSK